MATIIVPSSTVDRERLLRWALRGNALFSATCGLIGLVAAGPLAGLIGLEPLVLVILGGVLLPYAVALALAARRPIDRRFAWLAIDLDALWVIGSIAILLLGWPPLTDAGRWLVAILADIVAVFAIVQFVGLRRLR